MALFPPQSDAGWERYCNTCRGVIHFISFQIVKCFVTMHVLFTALYLRLLHSFEESTRFSVVKKPVKIALINY